MSLIFDGLLILLCVVIIVVETRRGFIKSVMNLGSHIAALFVAYAFTPKLAKFFNDNFFLEKISSGIRDTLKSLTENPSGEGTYNLSKLFSDLPEPFTEILDRYNVSLDSVSDQIKNVTDATEDAVNSLSDSISFGVANVLSSVAAFLLLFVGSILILKLVTLILDSLFKLPVLNSANKALGFLFGVVIALIIAFVFSILSVKLIGALNSISPDLFNQDVIDNSILLKFFANYNIFGVISNVLG